MKYFKKSVRLQFTLIFVFALLTVQSNLSAQSLKWARKFGSLTDETADAVIADSNGNIYTTGAFTGTVDFDPGAAVYNLTSFGSNDIFICKLDSLGHFVWAKQLGGTGDDHANGIALDPSNNVYTTGYFTGTADFNPSAATLNFISFGGTDIFIEKLDASGNFMYAKQMGGALDDISYSIAVNDSSQIFTTGYFGGSADFDPGAGVYNLTPVSSGDWDIFVSKLDASGNFVFAKQMGGNSSDWGICIALDKSRNIYTTGSFGSTADFDPGPGTYNLTSPFSNEVFISKLDPLGNFVWAKRMGGTGSDVGDALVIDDSNHVYSTGYFQSTADFDPGPGTFNITSNGGSDMFISKLDSMGIFMWAKRIGGTSIEAGSSIALDHNGHVFTTGYFAGSVDFDPGTGVYNMTSSSFNVFISKLNAAGIFIWAGQVGGTGYDYGGSIAADIHGNVYVSGLFEVTADFDPGTGTSNLSSTGGRDAFVLKLGACSSSSTISVTACSSYTSPSSNHIWTASGTYTDTISNVAGCDSIITIHLTIHNTSASTISVSACNSYISPSGNHIWTSNGIHTDTMTNASGCDSIITINLSILNSSTSTLSTSACSSYVSPSGNHVWTNSGTYTDTLNNAAGCDSIITIHLSINNSSSTLSVSACNSFISPSTNHVWTLSGIYTDTLTNATGCDSVLTIILTIHHSSSANINASACNSYTSPSGNHTWTTNGIYTDTIANSSGCDSILTINLSIHHATSGNITTSACKSHTSPSGHHVWSTNGIYTDTIANVFGCDSIISINLTINTVNVSVTNNSPVLQSNAVGATYQWLDCNNSMLPLSGETNQSFTATNNGSYAVQVTQNGCTDTSTCMNVVNVGVENLNPDKPTIYPNPTQEILQIDFNTLHDVEIRIYNLIGQEVLLKNITASRHFQVSVPGKAGVYILKLILENGTHSYYKINKK